MGWFWGSKNSEADPTQSLNEDLKTFLDQQHPKPYLPAEAPKKEPPFIPKPPPLPDTNTSNEDRPLPKESLFPDGRYKDLWKTYVSQDDITLATTTPAERVMTAKKDRQRSVNRAALENCAFEEELKLTCFTQGNAVNRIRARMTMCNQETKAFNRCYMLQAKFLQALGYLNNPQSTAEEEERIQMHADKLYHRMMDYEASVEEAKKTGQPVPPLSSVFNAKLPSPTVEQINLPSNIEKGLRKPLRELPPHERELAARAALQEAKLAQQHAEDFFKFTTTLNVERQERQKKLVGLLGEAVGKFLIPDPPDEHQIKAFDSRELDREFWKDDPRTTMAASISNPDTSLAKR